MRKLLASITAALLAMTGAQAANAGSIFDETFDFLNEYGYEHNQYQVNDFLGIQWEDLLEDESRFVLNDANPQDVNGYTEDAYDDWGFLYVSNDDFDTFQEIRVFSRETCVATDDGRPDSRPDNDFNHHSSLHCYSDEITIGGEKVRFELFHEFVGSFARTTITPMEGNELTGALDFAYTGETGTSSPTLEANSSSSTHRYAIISDRGSNNDGVIGFRAVENFEVYEANDSYEPTKIPFVTETSDYYFTFMFDDVITSDSGITVENFIVDYDDGGYNSEPSVTTDGDPLVTLPAAVILAEQLVDVPFGFCIASVEDATPDATNQCTDKYWAAVNSILIKPKRADQSGFPGLWVNLGVADGFGPDAPIFPLQEIDSGQNDDVVDQYFGYLHLSNATGTATELLTLDDFAACDARADGVSTRAVSNQGVDHFVIDCTDGNVTIDGATVDVDALIEVKGSSVAWQVDLSSSSSSAPIAVWLEGLLGNDNEVSQQPMTFDYTDSGSTTDVQKMIVSVKTVEDDIPVTAWEFNTPSTITTRDATVENATPASGSGAFGVLSESKVIGSETETFRFELTSIDSYRDFDNHAVELAEEYLENGYFGFCLPVVEQPIKPNMVDQCLALDNTALNFREVEKRTQWDVDGLENASENDSYMFYDVGVRNGQTLDARVTVEEVVGLVSDVVEDIDDGAQARQSDWNDQFLRIDTVAEITYPEGTPKESYTQLLIEFLNETGQKVTLSDVYLNTYDIDELQYFEVDGFDSYRLSDETSLSVVRAEGEALRFQSENENASTSANNIDDKVNYRVEVYFEKASEVRLRLGTDVSDLPAGFSEFDAIANYYLDFSTGPFWVSTVNTQAIAPTLERNFAKPVPPYSAPVSFAGPIVTDVEPAEINAGESFELIGQKLDLVESVTAGDTELEILESSDSRVLVGTNSDLAAATYELKINWSGGQLAFSPELTVLQTISSENLQFSYWTKKISDTEVKMYAKNVIGEGKIQFFEDGQEVAWIRAENEEDPKLTRAIGSYYMVRTIDLDPGKNRLEIRVDGERVRFNTYTG